MSEILEPVTKNPVTFTYGAIAELMRLKSSGEVQPGMFLRVGVKGGGCSGMTYVLAFDEKTDADNVYLINGIEVIMNKAHGMYLLGMEVDYQSGLNSRGFVFNNPNAKSTCGCGTSFSA